MPEMNPFADSVPFPDSAPLESGYEKMEEVSLEQLLSEGRERPATMAGTIAVPLIDVEEVEELGAEEMVAIEEPPVAVAVMEEEEAPAAIGGDGEPAAE